jgi:hypothetical protein
MNILNNIDNHIISNLLNNQLCNESVSSNENENQSNNKNYKVVTLVEYLTILDNKCKQMLEKDKLIAIKLVSKNDDITLIPTINNYIFILNKKNTLQQLKGFAKQYKLKVSGNKNELITRIYTYIKLSLSIIKIQKVFRAYLQQKYNKLHGPAFKNRNMCTNECDFLTIEPLKNLSYSQFFSYTDNDGFTYGFDVISLYNLILKSGSIVKNPYNRNKIPNIVIQNIRSLIKMSRLLKIPIDINIQDVNMDITQQKSLELRILDLFQNINALGNYSDPNWLSSLNKIQLMKFIRELQDIWEFRAQLTIESKRAICPPHGDLFRNSYLYSLHNEQNIFNIQKTILPILEKLVNSGLEKDNKSLGAYYVLGALTLVNENAASTLPWLYQSVIH